MQSRLDTFSPDDQKRITLYTAPEKFTQSAQTRPPYSSLLNYDEDYIWNVAGDPGPKGNRKQGRK
jgi:hypothetical protein